MAHHLVNSLQIGSQTNHYLYCEQNYAQRLEEQVVDHQGNAVNRMRRYIHVIHA